MEIGEVIRRGFDLGRAAEVSVSGKYKKVRAACSILCCWSVRELGMSQTQLAGVLRRYMAIKIRRKRSFESLPS